MHASTLRASAFSIPTRTPEADGTLRWDKTVLVIVELAIGDVSGLGYTYADEATAHFVCEHLAPIALDADVMAPTKAFAEMGAKVRNVGREGVAATAIAAVDMALWDAKAKLLGTSLAGLLGPQRPDVEAYASGGFTSYTEDELRAALREYVAAGFRQIKMKIGDAASTARRVEVAREVLGCGHALFVDANGAFSPRHAVQMARALEPFDVRWFEEPCSSDDIDGLRFVRDRAPAGMDIAAGEYGYTSRGLGRFLSAEAVDVLQADATRCGVTGFLQVAAMCEARAAPLSAHCAPAVHAHLGCVAATMMNVEYFYDHARVESMLFDGPWAPRGGKLAFDATSPGLGVRFKRADAAPYQTFDREIPS
jgi:L-alanine-DL-glutamate epimerase-like enolase superfamily enzyme